MGRKPKQHRNQSKRHLASEPVVLINCCLKAGLRTDLTAGNVIKLFDEFHQCGITGQGSMV